MRLHIPADLLTEAAEDIAELIREDFDTLTDRQIVDILIKLADASLPLGFIPGAGPVLEVLDGLVLRLFRGRLLRMVRRARARLSAAGSPS